MAAVLSLKDQCDSDEKEEFSEILNLVSYEDSDDDEPKRKEKDCFSGSKVDWIEIIYNQKPYEKILGDRNEKLVERLKMEQSSLIPTRTMSIRQLKNRSDFEDDNIASYCHEKPTALCSNLVFQTDLSQLLW